MIVRLLAVVLTFSLASARAADKLIVHEWGTFTSLQDEQGRTIGGINVEDEPVPDFVHQLDRMLLIRAADEAPIFYQGAPACHPDVTMRLETPVIYFHAPKDSPPITATATVRMSGGWLTQFYPNAAADARGGPAGEAFSGYRPLTGDTVGSLTWHDLRIGPATHRFPETQDPVWLSPRNVAAADVTTPAGQSERFLFYRGVANVPCPLQVSRVLGQEEDVLWAQDLSASIRPPLWLVDVRDDGVMGFRRIDEFDHTPPALPLAAARFAEFEHVGDNQGNLRDNVHAELVKAGLFPDEADALLNTWQRSYFKTPGQRLFFLVPRQWTDRVLPLEVSVPADVTRVMLGRLELVTPRQRELLKRIAQGPASDGAWFFAARTEARPIPPAASQPADYRAYRALGRFRDALVLDELARHPTEALKQFVENYRLQPAPLQQ